MIVNFPWPPRELSPNARVHWAKKAKAAKQYKADCMWIMKAAKPKTFNMELQITFEPPTKRRMDLDNMLSSFKYGIDAIAESLGVDDSKFRITISRDEATKNGNVLVLIA